MMIKKNHSTVIWLSANLFGYYLLQEAVKIESIKVVRIITLAGAAKTKMYDGISVDKWRQFGIPVYQTENINKEVILIRKLQPDYLIVAGWRQIISSGILKIPQKGVIGFHPTLLPFGRGPAPIINTILSRMKSSGVSMYLMNEKVDDGDIVGQEKFVIAKDDDVQVIHRKVIQAGKKLVKKYFPLLVSGKYSSFPQKENKAIYFPQRKISDNEIFINDSLETMEKKIRAFSKPYLGAFLRKGAKKLVIWKAEIKKNE